LVGIELASMTAVFCHNAADRKAETWRQQLLPFEHLEFVVSDAAKGIAAAVEQVTDQRRQKDETPQSRPPTSHATRRGCRPSSHCGLRRLAAFGCEVVFALTSDGDQLPQMSSSFNTTNRTSVRRRRHL
jgi:hypothetical protein